MVESESTASPFQRIRSMLRGLSLLTALVLLTATLSGGSLLLTRPLWMDEIHSWLLVTDDNPMHALEALRHGADFNPPSWFLITHGISSALAPENERFLRLLSLFWMLSALCGTYVLLSRCFNWLTCVAAVLLTACHPLLIHQSTEIRFYGFWCSCVIWLCCVFQWAPDGVARQRLRWILISLLSFITSTSHYFGILSLTTITVPLVVRRRQDPAGYSTALISVASGATGLCCCLPFIFGQKAALSRPTWISAPTAADSLYFLQYFFPVWPLLLCIAVLVVGRAIAEQKQPTTFCRLPARFKDLLPCAALALMPLMIVAVSWLLQPAMVARYAIVGVFGMAPIFAALLDQALRRAQWIALAAATALFASFVAKYPEQWVQEQSHQTQLICQLRRCPPGATVVFEDRIAWMPVRHYYPDLLSRCRLADFTEAELGDESALRIVQRDVGRRIQQWYPTYYMQPISQLTERSEFYVVPYFDQNRPGLKYPAGYGGSRFAQSIYRFQSSKTVFRSEENDVAATEHEAIDGKTF